MTVGELKDLLSNYDEDQEIVFKPSNSSYVEGLNGIKAKEMRSFWGPDRKVLVITSSGQDGAV